MHCIVILFWILMIFRGEDSYRKLNTLIPTNVIIEMM